MDIICGIYMIRNIINEKKYIGRSVNIKNRWSNHKYELNKGIHVNNHLQNAWNKYGQDNFEFSVVEECNESDLNDREIYWINYYDVYHNGYNQTIGGEGYELSDDIKLKISAAMKDLWLDDGYRNRMSEVHSGENATWYGKPRSEETKAKISQANKDRYSSPEACPMYGKHHTEDTKRKISEKNSHPSEETRKKLKDANSGKNNPRARAIYCIELDEYFWDATDAHNKYGINISDICRCCRGLKKSAGKHPITREKLHWVWADEWQVAV